MRISAICISAPPTHQNVIDYVCAPNTPNTSINTSYNFTYLHRTSYHSLLITCPHIATCTFICHIICQYPFKHLPYQSSHTSLSHSSYHIYFHNHSFHRTHIFITCSYYYFIQLISKHSTFINHIRPRTHSYAMLSFKTHFHAIFYAKIILSYIHAFPHFTHSSNSSYH